MKTFDELKKGDKLYELAYYSDGRSWTTLTIKKKYSNRCSLERGYKWGVTRRTYGDSYFPSKLEAIKHSLEKHEDKFYEIEQDYKNYRREIAYLKRKIKEAEQ